MLSLLRRSQHGAVTQRAAHSGMHRGDCRSVSAHANNPHSSGPIRASQYRGTWAQNLVCQQRNGGPLGREDLNVALNERLHRHVFSA